MKRISKEYNLETNIRVVDWLYIINSCVVEWPSESEFTIEKAKKELIILDYIKNVHDNSKVKYL